MRTLVLVRNKNDLVVLNVTSICTIRKEAEKWCYVCSLADGTELECSPFEFDTIVAASGGIYKLDELMDLP